MTPQSKPALYQGARMNAEKFHLLYCGMPENYKAELIGGIVHEPPPPGIEHSDIHFYLSSVFAFYVGRTRGLHGGNCPTVILSKLDEVEPDLVLRIAPEYGGQSKNVRKIDGPDPAYTANYFQGAPELVAEVSFYSRNIDLKLKRKRYQLSGVIEYIVVDIKENTIHWFDLVNKKDLQQDEFEIFRSQVFPGFWINQKALLNHDYDLLMQTIDAGMKTQEYYEFSSQLALRKK